MRQSNNSTTTTTVYQEYSTINQEVITSPNALTFTETNTLTLEKYPDSGGSGIGSNENIDAIIQDYLNNPELSSRIISTNTRVFGRNELRDLVQGSQTETVDMHTVNRIAEALRSAYEHRNARQSLDDHINQRIDFNITDNLTQLMNNHSVDYFVNWISSTGLNPLSSLFEQIFLTWGDSIAILMQILPAPSGGISIALFFILSSTFSKIWVVLTSHFAHIRISVRTLSAFYRRCMNRAIDHIRAAWYTRNTLYAPTEQEAALPPVVLGQARSEIEAISQETDRKIKELKKKEDDAKAASALEASNSFSVNQVFTQIHLDLESFFGSIYTWPLGWMMSWFTGFNMNPSRSVGRLIIFGTLGLGINTLSSWFLGINPLGWLIPRSFRIIFHPRNRWSRFLDEIGDAFKNYAKK